MLDPCWSHYIHDIFLFLYLIKYRSTNHLLLGLSTAFHSEFPELTVHCSLKHEFSPIALLTGICHSRQTSWLNATNRKQNADVSYSLGKMCSDADGIYDSMREFALVKQKIKMCSACSLCILGSLQPDPIYFKRILQAN